MLPWSAMIDTIWFITMLWLLGLAWMGMLPAPALAAGPESGPMGVLVRLEPGGQPITGVPSVVLVPTSEGETLVVELNDDGAPPDVLEADGIWAGVAMTDLQHFTVEVHIGDEVRAGGVVDWKDGTRARDLVLTLTADGVSAVAGAPDALRPEGPEAGGEPSARLGAVPQGVGSPPVSPSNRSTAADDGWMWVALGIGALSLVGGLVLVLRGGRPAARGVDLDRAPEPPMFGPGTPRLDAGLEIWSHDGHLDVWQSLVATIARHHRVLLVVDAQMAVPAVFGGPVYVCRSFDMRELERHLDDLDELGGLPIVVVVAVEKAEDGLVVGLRELLEPDLGGLLLVRHPSVRHPATAALVSQAGGALLTVGEVRVNLDIHEAGLVRASPS